MTLNGNDAPHPGAAVPAGVPDTLPPDWRKWLSRTRSCARLGLDSRRFDKLVTEGELPAPLICPDGTKRWDPNVIDALTVESEDTPNPNEARAVADMGKANAAQVAVSTQHAERLIQLLERPIHTAMENLRKTNLDLREENEALRERLHIAEQARSDLITARESLLSDQAARDLAVRESQNRDERRKEIFQVFKGLAPPMVKQIARTLGVKSEDEGKVQAVIALAQDLDPAILEMLASTGALTDQQVGYVETIIGKSIKRPEAPKAPESSESNG